MPKPESAKYDPRRKTFDTKFLLYLTSDLRDSIKETGNASGYLRAAARERLQQVEEAITLLRENGWTEEEVRTAVQEASPSTSLLTGADTPAERAILVLARELDGPSDHVPL